MYQLLITGHMQIDCTVGSGNVTNTYELVEYVTTVSGCTDSTATNYDPTATVDDGSCQYPPVVCAEDAPTNLSDECYPKQSNN